MKSREYVHVSGACDKHKYHFKFVILRTKVNIIFALFYWNGIAIVLYCQVIPKLLYFLKDRTPRLERKKKKLHVIPKDTG